MNLYLIRHAHAVDADEDVERPLSKRGREQVQTLATFLRPSKAFAPDEVWHSPLARARETAELLVDRLDLKVSCAVMPDLLPEDDPRAVARRIKAVTRAIAIVGHEPHLSALATLLAIGTIASPVFVMKKCAVISLEGAGPHWQVRWHVSPEVLA